jgi:hypothetical protein
MNVKGGGGLYRKLDVNEEMMAERGIRSIIPRIIVGRRGPAVAEAVTERKRIVNVVRQTLHPQGDETSWAAQIIIDGRQTDGGDRSPATVKAGYRTARGGRRSRSASGAAKHRFEQGYRRIKRRIQSFRHRDEAHGGQGTSRDGRSLLAFGSSIHCVKNQPRSSLSGIRLSFAFLGDPPIVARITLVRLSKSSHKA